MKNLPLVLVLLSQSGATAASFLPTLTLDPQSVRAFDAYVARHEQGEGAEFARSGKMWIDSQPAGKRQDYDANRIVVQALPGEDLPNGQIHHVLGAMRVPGATIDSVHRTMQNYAAYKTVYRPDVGVSSGELLPDSTEADEHYKIALRLVQSTLWFDVTFESGYDTHFVRLAPQRSLTRTHSTGIREYRNAHDLAAGLFPEGEDHGFAWRLNTWWHVRERDNGVDMEIVSISLSRQPPAGFGWWSSRRARQAVENLMNQTRVGIMSQSAQVPGSSAKPPAGR